MGMRGSADVEDVEEALKASGRDGEIEEVGGKELSRAVGRFLRPKGSGQAPETCRLGVRERTF